MINDCEYIITRDILKKNNEFHWFCGFFKFKFVAKQIIDAVYVGTCPLLAILMDNRPPPLSELNVTLGLSTPSGSRKFWFSHMTT